MKTHNVSCGTNVTLNGRVMFVGKGSIEIGNNTRIHSHIKYNPIGGNSGCIFNTRTSDVIRIGENVGISNSTFVSETSITIEPDVLVGGSCYFYDTDFHSLAYEDRLKKPDLSVISKPITIKRGAFIGAHYIVLKGVSIGEKSIIGA